VGVERPPLNSIEDKMKQIALKTVDMDIQGVARKLSYKNELQIIFSAPADMSKGANVEEMRRSIRILDALDKSTDVLELEDADFVYLKDRVPNAKFAFVHSVLVQFVDDVTKE
jgi:hypothetical protein